MSMRAVIIILSLFYSCCSFSQHQKTKVITYQAFDLKKDTSEWKISRIQYYDGGLLKREIFNNHYLSAREIEPYISKDYEYSNNLLIKLTSLRSDSIAEITEYLYNKDKLLISEIKFEESTAIKKLIKTRTINYNDSNLIISEVISQNIGNNYLNSEYRLYFYHKTIDIKHSYNLDSIVGFQIENKYHRQRKIYTDDYTCCSSDTHRRKLYAINGNITYGPSVTEYYEGKLLIENFFQNESGWTKYLRFQYNPGGQLIKSVFYENNWPRVYQKLVYE